MTSIFFKSKKVMSYYIYCMEAVLLKKSGEAGFFLSDY